MNFFRSIKESLKDPKKKSITLLVFYLIFFIIVFILFGISDSKKNNYVPISKEENKIEKEEYFYKYSIITDDSITEYNILDNDKYRYDALKELINKSISKTTYKEDNKIVYSIELYEYFALINELDNCDNIDCHNLVITLTLDKEDFEEVTIDLSNYYSYNYKIKIEYSILR